MTRFCSRALLILIIVSMFVLAIAPIAQAASTSVNGDHIFFASYDGENLMFHVTSNLSNQYVIDSVKKIQINTNHGLVGVRYNVSGILQFVTGSIAYYDGGNLRTRLTLSSSGPSYVPPGTTGWGGSNSSTVNLCTIYGNDWVQGDISWSGRGPLGNTFPSAKFFTLKKTYR